MSPHAKVWQIQYTPLRLNRVFNGFGELAMAVSLKLTHGDDGKEDKTELHTYYIHI